MNNKHANFCFPTKDKKMEWCAFACILGHDYDLFTISHFESEENAKNWLRDKVFEWLQDNQLTLDGSYDKSDNNLDLLRGAVDKIRTDSEITFDVFKVNTKVKEYTL